MFFNYNINYWINKILKSNLNIDWWNCKVGNFIDNLNFIIKKKYFDFVVKFLFYFLNKTYLVFSAISYTYALGSIQEIVGIAWSAITNGLNAFLTSISTFFKKN